jgi:hypothetical protein
MRNHKATTNEEMAPTIQAHVTTNPSQDNFGSHGNSHIGKIMCCFDRKKTKDTSGSLNSCRNFMWIIMTREDIYGTSIGWTPILHNICKTRRRRRHRRYHLCCAHVCYMATGRPQCTIDFNQDVVEQIEQIE